MPQISASVNQDSINDINRLASQEKPKRSFSQMVDILLQEALEARNKSKNAKK